MPVFSAYILFSGINEPPKAHAGGNVQVTLPKSSVQINGSTSSDDVKIVDWKWERQPESLAAGIILTDTDHSPLLQVFNFL